MQLLYLYSKKLKEKCNRGGSILMIINDGYYDTQFYNKTIEDYKKKNINLKTVLTSDGGCRRSNYNTPGVCGL